MTHINKFTSATSPLLYVNGPLVTLKVTVIFNERSYQSINQSINQVKVQ